MLADGLKLISETSALETTRIKFGTSFPLTPTSNELFHLTTNLSNVIKEGLYLNRPSGWKSVVSLLDTAINVGTSFPVNPIVNELYYLVSDITNYKKGLYVNRATIGWEIMAADTSIKTGTAFPSDPVDGQAFYLSATYQGRIPGLYRYNVDTVEWNYATSSEYVAENVAHKNVANGYAGLDGNALISDSLLYETNVNASNTFPTTPILNQLHYLTNDIDVNTKSGLYIKQASGWVSVTSDTSIKIGTAFPATPADGLLYYLSATYQGHIAGLYRYNATLFDWDYATSSEYIAEDVAHKNVANGYAGLDSSGLVDLALLYDTTVRTGTSFPSTFLANELFCLTTNITNYKKGLYVSLNNTWTLVSPETTIASGTTLPASPVSGLLYYLTTAYSTYIAGLYRYDGTNLVWQYATSSAYTAENVAHKNAANGYAGLDANSKIYANQLPSIAITDTFVINTQAAMLALTAQTGDVAVRSDLRKSYILSTDDPTTLANWKELQTPTDVVTSVNGLTGDVQFYTEKGTTFPTTPFNKQLFFLTALSGTYKRGLYYYSATTWEPAYYDINVPYDIAGYTAGLPIANSKMLLFVASRIFTIPANYAGSVAKSANTALANTIYVIKKNGTQIGTITFAGGSSDGTFSAQSSTTFNIGDVMSIDAPAVIDSTHANIMWTILTDLE